MAENIELMPWQSDFFTSPERYKVAVCGRRSGKTFVSTAIIYNAAMTNVEWTIWYIAPTQRMARRLMFKPLIKLIPPAFVEHIDKTRMEITLTNGTEICVKGSDNPDSLLGEGIHLLVLDEYQSQKEEVWWIIRPTLSDYQARVVILGTPRGYNHFHELWYNGWHENHLPMPNWKSWQIKTAESGTILAEEIEDAKRTMSPSQFNQEYNASFESLTGMVYCEFDPTLNVRDDITLMPDLNGTPHIQPLRIGMDFNVDPMTASIGVIIEHPELSISGERELWIVDEIYLEDSNTREMIKVLQQKYGIPDDKDHPYYKYKKIVYPDPAGGARSTVAQRDSTNHTLLQESTARYTLIGHKKKHPSIIDSVNEVNGLLCNAHGVRRMYIHPRCKNVIKTMKGLTYDNGLPDKTTGLDHMSDGVRYLVHNEFPIKKNNNPRNIQLSGF